MPAAARSRASYADDPVPVARRRPRNDVYTALLAISLVALLASSLLLFLDYKNYTAKTPPAVSPPQISGK